MPTHQQVAEAAAATREQALARLGARSHQVEWIEHPHYWLLSYQLK